MLIQFKTKSPAKVMMLPLVQSLSSNLNQEDEGPPSGSLWKAFSILNCGALLCICTINSEAESSYLSYFSPKCSPTLIGAGTALISNNCVFMLLSSSSPEAKGDRYSEGNWVVTAGSRRARSWIVFILLELIFLFSFFSCFVKVLNIQQIIES